MKGTRTQVLQIKTFTSFNTKTTTPRTTDSKVAKSHLSTQRSMLSHNKTPKSKFPSKSGPASKIQTSTSLDYSLKKLPIPKRPSSSNHNKSNSRIQKDHPKNNIKAFSKSTPLLTNTSTSLQFWRATLMRI